MITVLGQKSSKFTPDLYFKLMVHKRLKSCSKEKTSVKIMKNTFDLVTGVIYCGEVETEMKKTALGKCSTYLSKLQKNAPENSPSVIETHNVKKAFKIPLSKDKDIDNPGWINILFPTHEKFVLTQIPEGWELEPYTEEKDVSTHSYIFFQMAKKTKTGQKAWLWKNFKKPIPLQKSFLKINLSNLKRGVEKVIRPV